MQVLCVLSLVQRRGTLQINDLQKEPKLHPALTAGGWSCVSVLSTWLGLLSSSCNLDNWYLWWSRLKDGFGLFKYSPGDEVWNTLTA